MSAAAKITRKAKSNLALALKLLPKERREDMTVFYAFCRTVDDIADDVSKSVENRRELLKDWERGFEEGFCKDDVLGCEVGEMVARRGIPVGWMQEIIAGCAMDLEVLRFQGWEELSRYNWQVAGVVGLVSTRIFGCVHEDSDKYAVALGHALQLTNILRDVGEDLASGGRIYLPVNDMMRFQYSERDLVGKVYDGRFLALMSYEAERAEHYFAEAEGLIPEVDRKALLPARMMAEVYRVLLRRIRSGEFQVFDKRHTVSGFTKAFILLKYLVAR